MRAVVVWLHLVGMTLWLGGIFVNTLALEPSLKAISPAERGKLMGAFIKRFVPLAWGAIALVVVTGFVLTNGISGFSALVGSRTRYGNILLVKHILIAVMILNGAYLGLVLGRRIASFAPPPGASEPTSSGKEDRPPGPPPQLLRLQKRMTTLSWVEVGLALAVLFLMGLL
ncbi:MAG: CopD family protein [Candidatus Zixiibacteriota bacterium]